MNHSSPIQRTLNINHSKRSKTLSLNGRRCESQKFCLCCKIITLKLVKTNLIDVFPHLLELVNWNQKLVSEIAAQSPKKVWVQIVLRPEIPLFFFHRTFHFDLIDTYWCNLVCARQFLLLFFSFFFPSSASEVWNFSENLSINLIHRVKCRKVFEIKISWFDNC